MNSVFNKISYKEYNLIKDISNQLAIILSSAPRLITDDVVIGNVTSIAGISMLAVSIYLRLSHKNIETYDYKEVNELYKEVIKNYAKLNNDLDVKNPVEASILFSNLLYLGYLSANKSFRFENSTRDTDKDIGKYNVIVGKAVCRHIAPFLADVLNEMGIDAKTLGVSSAKINSSTIEEVYLPELKQNISIVTQEYEKQRFTPYTNHVITVAKQEDMLYFLDPTNAVIYRYNENSKDNILHGDNVDARTNKHKMSRLIKMSPKQLTLTKQNALIEQANQKVSNNMDLFDKFYQENEDLYYEIKMKTLRMK